MFPPLGSPTEGILFVKIVCCSLSYGFQRPSCTVGSAAGVLRAYS